MIGPVSNPRYDKDATSGKLQDGCDKFEINNRDILWAMCNKVTGDTIEQHYAHVGLEPDTDDACSGHAKDIQLASDSVTLLYTCPEATGDKVLSLDLNIMVRWDPSPGELSLIKG